MRGSLWTLISTAVQLPMAVLSTVVIAHALSPQSYGRAALLGFAIALTTAITGLGLTAVFLRKVALAHGGDDRDEQRHTLRMAATAYAGQAAAILIVSALLMHGWLPVALMAAYSGCYALWAPAAVLVTATNRGALAAQTTLVSAVLTVVTQIAVALTTHNPDLMVASGLAVATLPHVALVWLAGPFAITLPGWARVRLLREEWRFALMTLAGEQVTTLVFSQSELAFFGRARAYDQGRYAAISTVGARASLLIDSLFGSVAPALTTLRGRERAEFDRGVAALFRLSTALFTPLFPTALVGAVVLTPYVFPPSYGDLRVWVVPLIAVSLLQTAAQPALSAWAALGRAGGPLTAAVIGAVVNLALSATLIPRYGLPGAVIASAAGGLSYLGVIATSFRGIIGRRLCTRYLGSAILSTVVGASIALAVSRGGSHLWAAFLAIPAAGTIGLLMLWAVRPLRSDDLELIATTTRAPVAAIATRLLKPAVGRG